MAKHTLSNIFSRKYVLASQSQRRLELLLRIGLDLTVVVPGVEETGEGTPLKVVKLNALKKSRAAAFNYQNEIVIAADTIVALDGKIIGKPKSEKDAYKILRELSGKKHFVYTGVNIIDTKNGHEEFVYEKTEVIFRELRDEEIKHYINVYKPFDKAGSYGVQDGFGCLFIDKIKGDFYNIVGLPLVKVYEVLIKL